jgi:hypothetical protein
MTKTKSWTKHTWASKNLNFDPGPPSQTNTDISSISLSSLLASRDSPVCSGFGSAIPPPAALNCRAARGASLLRSQFSVFHFPESTRKYVYTYIQ